MKKFTLLTTAALVLILASFHTYADTTFVAGTLINETWIVEGSPYCVTDDIFVSGLAIEPGVEIIFLGNFTFEIGGVINSIGTEQDTIKFNKIDTIAGWQGIYFNYSSPGSEIAYTRIEGSINSGMRIINSEPIIRNSLITNNSATSGIGGGIYTNSAISIEDCIISYNSITTGDIYHFGAGIYSILELTLINCDIIFNSMYRVGSNIGTQGGGIYANGLLSLKNCTIHGNSLYAHGSNWSNHSHGAGIRVETGQLILENCIVSSNSASASSSAGGTSTFAYGGGISLSDGMYTIANTLISDNILSDSYNIKGGGIYCNDITNPSNIENSTIAYNSHEGIFFANGSNDVINSIIWGNNSTQISGIANVTYSDVQDGFTGEGNINLNPIFYSDTHLHIVPGSPCIDAGNPDPIFYDVCFPPSLGTEINDMGVDGGPLACNWDIVTGINEFGMGKINIYPNPFSTKTTIEFYDLFPSINRLSILNISGTKVFEINNIKSDKIVFERNNLPKGIYFIVLISNEYKISEKMIIR